MERVLFVKKFFNVLAVIVLALIFSAGMFEDKETKPTVAKTLDQRVKESVIAAVGEKTNMGDKRIIAIGVDKGNIAIMKLHASENFTDNMTRDSLWVDTKKLLQKVFENPEIDTLFVEWDMPFVDSYGNITLKPVMQMDFTRENVAKIKFDTMPMSGIPKVAEHYTSIYK